LSLLNGMYVLARPVQLLVCCWSPIGGSLTSDASAGGRTWPPWP